MFLVQRTCLIFVLSLFFLASASTQTNSSDTILYEIYPFVRVYRNGTIQRFIGTETVPASTDPVTGVHSKDVQFDPRSNLFARIYIPKTATPFRKLPLLVYFHGGGFFTESAFSPIYHNHLNSLVAKANVVAVSVNYRLAPEHPLPIGYQDSWLAMKWVFSHFRGNGNESWIKSYADFRRVYLGGDSAGANIAHQMGIRIGLEKPEPGIRVVGMFLNCPFFGGKRAIGNESADASSVTFFERVWVHAYPKTSGMDDPLMNPGMDPKLKMLGCKRVLVYVAGNDFLRFRGLYYRDELEKSGWKGSVKVVEVEGQGHVFNLLKPTTPKSIAMLKNLAFFLNH